MLDEDLIMRIIKNSCIIILLSLIVTIIGITGCGRYNNDAGQDVNVSADSPGTQSVAETDATLTITAIKGGAADAFVLMNGEHVTLIDTGLDKKADKLVEFLKEQGVTRIDELIITHFDKDHVGGADYILSEFEVGTVYTTYRSKDSDDIISYDEALSAAGLTETVVEEITTFTADGVSYTIYPPQSRMYADSISNNSSLVIKVSVGENSMLFAGDAEFERIRELIATPGLESVILKVPHHGRLAANSRQFIEYISPEYAIITSSQSEPADQEVLDILDSLGVTTYFTLDGNVTIVMTSSDITVTQ